MSIQLINYNKLKENWNPNFYTLEPATSPYDDTKGLDEVCDILPNDRKVRNDEVNTFSKYVDVSCIDKEKGVLQLEKDIEEKVSRRLRYKANEGDLLIPLVDTDKIPPVIVSTENKNSVLVSDIFAVLVPKVDVDYLYWAFTTDYVKKQLLARQQGATLKRISVKALKEIKIPWLNEEERQKKIQMIKEKHNHLNKEGRQLLLEKTNQVLEHYFTINKLEDAGGAFLVPYSQLKGEKWNVPSLHHRYDKFIDQIREKVNDVYSLSEIISVVAGVNPSKHKSGELTQTPIIKGKNIDVHVIKGEIDNVELKTTGEKEKIKVGDILYRIKGNIGPAAIVTSEIEGLVFHDHLVKMTVDHDRVRPEYLSFVLNSYIVNSQIQRYVLTSTAQFISVQDLMKVIIPMPDLREQDKIIQQIINES